MRDRERKENGIRETPPRRRFMRRAVEVAAGSLFGTMGFSVMMKSVVERMAELQGLDQLAGQVAEDLRQNGAAYADDYCPL